MRFKRWPRHPFTDTVRKRAALRRKHRKEQEALPLFADQIAAAQPGEDEVMAARAEAWAEQEMRDRRRRAGEWRRARRLIEALPIITAARMRRVWACAPYPADPVALLGMLHAMEVGRMDLAQPPFPLSRTDASGRRVADLFEPKGPPMLMSILKARDIAEAPDHFTLEERRSAYRHLHAAANKNKDKTRASQDRVLAAQLWPRLGELEDSQDG